MEFSILTRSSFIRHPTEQSFEQMDQVEVGGRCIGILGERLFADDFAAITPGPLFNGFIGGLHGDVFHDDIVNALLPQILRRVIRQDAFDLPRAERQPPGRFGAAAGGGVTDDFFARHPAFSQEIPLGLHRGTRGKIVAKGRQ
jgi:hypothetical protein